MPHMQISSQKGYSKVLLKIEIGRTNYHLGNFTMYEVRKIIFANLSFRTATITM